MIITLAGCLIAILTLWGWQQTNIVESSDGYPVWSSNPELSEVAGIHKYYNIGLNIPPLNGWVKRFRPRYRVYIENFNIDSSNFGSSNRYFITEKLSDHPLSLYYMKGTPSNPYSYVLVNYLEQPEELRESFIIVLNDYDDTEGGDDAGNSIIRTNKEYLSNYALGSPRSSYTAIPSPDGSVIAALAWNTTRIIEDQVQEMELRYAFLDSETLGLKYVSNKILIPEVRNPFFFWTSVNITNNNTKDETFNNNNNTSNAVLDESLNVNFTNSSLDFLNETSSSGIPIRSRNDYYLVVTDRDARSPSIFISLRNDGSLSYSEARDIPTCIVNPTSSGLYHSDDGTYVVYNDTNTILDFNSLFDSSCDTDLSDLLQCSKRGCLE